MKTISQNQFVEFMSEALPELIASITREDTNAVSKGQVSVPQFWALHYISRQEGLTVNELTMALHRSKSSTSALLQRLENSGLVKRIRSSADQRVVHVSLTPKGRRLIDRLIENRRQGVRNTYAALSASERNQQKQLMEKILKSIQKSIPLLLAAATCLFSPRIEAETNQYTLAESIQFGLKQSLAVVNAARQREIAETVRMRALSEAMPSVTGIADYSLYDAENLTESGSKTIGAEASWQIYSGGRTWAAIRASKTYRQLTAYQERRVRETQVRDIALVYYQVQLAKTRTRVIEQSVKQLADFEREARQKYDAGTLSEFDWLSAKVALANEKPQLIAAQNDLSLAREQFRNLTYLETDRFELSDPLEYIPVDIDLDEAISLGLKKRPELLEKVSAVALRAEDINQQRSEYYPDINLFANYNTYDPDPYSFLPGSTSAGWQDHWSAGARATWSLFDGGLRKANLSESKLNMAIEEDEYRDLVRTVSLEIRTQWLRGRDAAEVIDSTTENVGLAERALRIARSRFDAGLSTNLEVTQANLELGKARLARSQALYEHMAAVTKMKYATGTLLEEYEDE